MRYIATSKPISLDQYRDRRGIKVTVNGSQVTSFNFASVSTVVYNAPNLNISENRDILPSSIFGLTTIFFKRNGDVFSFMSDTDIVEISVPRIFENDEEQLLMIAYFNDWSVLSKRPKDYMFYQITVSNDISQIMMAKLSDELSEYFSNSVDYPAYVRQAIKVLTASLD